MKTKVIQKLKHLNFYPQISGSTALIAILEGTHLIVANVGDSRGVMCDSKGNAIPLSFDHKPQQVGVYCGMGKLINKLSIY